MTLLWKSLALVLVPVAYAAFVAWMIGMLLLLVVVRVVMAALAIGAHGTRMRGRLRLGVPRLVRG